MGFVKVNDPMAEGVHSIAKKFLEGLGLSLSKIRSQGYDGACVMSGIHGGVQNFVEKMVDCQVPFVHYGCHSLNLVIKDAVSSVQENESFFGHLHKVLNFFFWIIGEYEGRTKNSGFSRIFHFKENVCDKVVFRNLCSLCHP